MSETQTVTIADFLLARYAEDEEAANEALSRGADPEPEPWRAVGWSAVEHLGPVVLMDPSRVLAECEAKRRIIECHKNWPVLVESPPDFTQDTGDLTSVTMRVSQQIAWTTEQRYREMFGTEPPTGPILRALALPYADHPDYRPEWRP